MSAVGVIAMAVGLGMDAMSVSAAVGVRWHGRRQRFRLAWHMGLFQFLMPIIGWAAGSRLAGPLQAVGPYVAAALVFAVGAKMLYESLRSRPGAVEEGIGRAVSRGSAPPAGGEGSAASDPTRGWSLVALSVATSLDALVVGISLGLKGAGAIWWTSAAIGLVAAGMSLTGVATGRFAGRALGRWAEVVGAVVLMGLGVSFPLW
jgi:putative Mn2+ efflux pump MntP